MFTQYNCISSAAEWNNPNYLHNDIQSRHSALNSLLVKEFIAISNMSFVGLDENLKVTFHQE
jgi:hypothetical protein